MLWLLQTETEQAYKLETFAADAWRALAVYGNMDATLDFLQTRYSTDPDALRNHLQEVTQNLIDAKLVETLVAK